MLQDRARSSRGIADQRVVSMCVRIIAAGLCLPLAQLAFAGSDAVSGAGALAARASIDVAISVPRVMQMRLIGHPVALDITAEDVARGSISVSGPSIDLVVNDRAGYNLRAELVSAVFTAV